MTRMISNLPRLTTYAFKYSMVYRYCTEIFDYLSLSAIIDDKVFCVHGGLSPAINTLDQVCLLAFDYTFCLLV